MKRNSRSILAILMALAMLGLVACSGDGSSADEKAIVAEAFNVDGDYAIPAVGYNEATAFTVEKVANFTEAKAAGTTIKIKNGVVVNDRELIKVTLGEGKLPVKGVYISDGRENHKKMEQQEDGSYVVDYKFNTSLSAHPLLVYVLHPSGMDDINYRASKAKFVVKALHAAGKSDYVRDGVALMLPEAVLAELGGSLGGLLGAEGVDLGLSTFKEEDFNSVKSATVDSIEKAKETYALKADLPLGALLDMEMSNLPVSLGVNDGMGTIMAGIDPNENVRPGLKLTAATQADDVAELAMEAIGGDFLGIGKCLIGKILEAIGGGSTLELTGILDLLNGLLGILPQNVSLVLGDLLGDLTADMGDDPLLGGVLDSLNLDAAALFVGINHVPTKGESAISDGYLANEHMAIIGAGLFGKNNCTVVSTLDGDSARFPLKGVSVYDAVLSEEGKDEVLEETYLMNQYYAKESPLSDDAKKVIAAYIANTASNDPKLNNVIGIDLNTQLVVPVLAGLLGGMDIQLPGTALPIPLGIPGYSKADARPQWVYATINPEGVVLDTTRMVLGLNDVRLEYYEWGAKGSGQPLWLMSLDLNFALDLSMKLGDKEMDEDDFLKLKLSLAEDLCGVTVLKDDHGVGIFDNSDFHKALWAELGGMLGAKNGVMEMELNVSTLLYDEKLSAEDNRDLNYIDVRDVVFDNEHLFLGVDLNLGSLLGGLL